MDPPYVPRADDNCYIKRYHFLEGLSRYWEGVTLLEDSRVKKIKKPYTPFSYRKDSLAAFDRLLTRGAGFRYPTVVVVAQRQEHSAVNREVGVRFSSITPRGLGVTAASQASNLRVRVQLP